MYNERPTKRIGPNLEYWQWLIRVARSEILGDKSQV